MMGILASNSGTVTGWAQGRANRTNTRTYAVRDRLSRHQQCFNCLTNTGNTPNFVSARHSDSGRAEHWGMGSCESCNGPRTPPTLGADELPEKITEFEGLEVAEVNSLRKEFMDMDKVLSLYSVFLEHTS